MEEPGIATPARSFKERAPLVDAKASFVRPKTGASIKVSVAGGTMILLASVITATAAFMDQANYLPGIGRTAEAGAKTVNLALQGGGSHGAFTWGVLDRLLEKKDLRSRASLERAQVRSTQWYWPMVWPQVAVRGRGKP